jgi:hypothetical protein
MIAFARCKLVALFGGVLAVFGEHNGVDLEKEQCVLGYQNILKNIFYVSMFQYVFLFRFHIKKYIFVCATNRLKIKML